MQEAGVFLEFPPNNLQKSLDNFASISYNSEAVRREETKYAAIAQPVERILGKDEVASSNLASSSKAPVIDRFQGFSFAVRIFMWQKFKSANSIRATASHLCSGGFLRIKRINTMDSRWRMYQARLFVSGFLFG